MELEDLVHLCLERLEARGAAALDELCLEHPALASPLRERIGALRAAGLLDTEEWSGSKVEESFPADFGDFRLERRLGSGGMGVVHLAQQLPLARLVALKRIHPGELYFPGSRERFRREALAVAALSHPGIVTIHEVREEAGVPCLVMEYVPGASLSELIEHFADRAPAELSARELRKWLASVSPLDDTTGAGGGALELAWDGDWWRVCAHLVRQVAQALDHAHQRGVVHRDVKPSNILLSSEDGRARLVDFGLASLQGSARVTRTGARLGSLAYTPPERLSSENGSSGPSDDVYSLGVTLCELATLRTPFLSTSSEATLRNILGGVSRQATSSMPRDLGAICAKAMERKPQARYPSASAFARDLIRFIDGEPTEARPLGPVRRVMRSARRRPALAIATVLLAVAIVAGPVVWSLVQARLLREERRHGAEMRAIATSLFTDVHDEIRELHGSLEVRRRLIEVGMSYLAQVRERAVHDPLVRADLAQGLMRAGDVYGHPGQPNLGEIERALECYAEAGRLFAALGEGQPEDSEWPMLESRAYIHSAAVNLACGRVAEARSALEEADRIVTSLQDVYGEYPGVRKLELQILMDRADLALRSDEAAGSEEFIRRAGALARKGLAEGIGEGDEMWRAIDRADALDVRHAILSGGLDAGLALLESQREARERQTLLQQRDPAARARLVAFDRTASRRCAQAGRFDLAIEWLERALASGQKASTSGPLWNDMALLRLHRKEGDLARAALTEAERAATADGAIADRTTQLARAKTLELSARVDEELAGELESALQHDERCARLLEELLEEYPGDPELISQASEVHFRAARIQLRRAGAAASPAEEVTALQQAREAFRAARLVLEHYRPADIDRFQARSRSASLLGDEHHCDEWIAALR